MRRIKKRPTAQILQAAGPIRGHAHPCGLQARIPAGAVRACRRDARLQLPAAPLVKRAPALLPTPTIMAARRGPSLARVGAAGTLKPGPWTQPGAQHGRAGGECGEAMVCGSGRNGQFNALRQHGIRHHCSLRSPASRCGGLKKAAAEYCSSHPRADRPPACGPPLNHSPGPAPVKEP